MSDKSKENKNQTLYNLLIALDIEDKDLKKYDIDENDFLTYKKIKVLKGRINPDSVVKTDSKTVVDCKQVEPEKFGQVVSFLRKYDERYEKNLDEKEDYSHYECYMSNEGLAGFCIDEESRERCNLYSVAKGLGREIADYAMFNYDCLGLANRTPEAYHDYYKARYDVVPSHWEENWDFPGEKDKAILYGWVLPKGVLSEEERADMLITAERGQRQACPEADVMACPNKDILCILSDEQKDVLDKAKGIVKNIIKHNQMHRANKSAEYA